MPTITALLHTENDALRVGRCLELLYPCDQIVVVDHGSIDATVGVAREYGAHVIRAAAGTGYEEYVRMANSAAAGRTGSGDRHSSPDAGWILCIDPHESLTESLAASLYEWKLERRASASSVEAFSVFLRQETGAGWVQNPAAQTRLVPPDWKRWQGRFPVSERSSVTLEGELLRFVFP
ncbi:MAG TPA: glycosyltransferase [Terriglobales bacterium]|nr:glycosyltransferase [Terriglobales bacterium]